MVPAWKNLLTCIIGFDDAIDTTMLLRRFSWLFFLIFFLVEGLGIQTTQAQECSPPKDAKKLTLLPFSLPPKLSKSPPAEVLRVLLKDYLSLDKKIFVLPLRPSSKSEGTYLLKTSWMPEGGKIESHLYNPDNHEILFLSDTMKFPEEINNFLPEWAEKISEAIGSKVKKKRWRPYLHQTTQTEAYYGYAQGRLLLAQGTSQALEDSVSAFEQALQKDYNDVYIYLGLAEALARKGQQRARVEMEKAKILNPPVASLFTKRIEELLKGEEKNLCE